MKPILSLQDPFVLLSKEVAAELAMDLALREDKYNWSFYQKWFGGRPYDAPEHIEMDACVMRALDNAKGGILWNLKFIEKDSYISLDFGCGWSSQLTKPTSKRPYWGYGI